MRSLATGFFLQTFFLIFRQRNFVLFFEEIRAGREEGGIQMHEVEALNSGNNQTVKSSFAEERSNIFFLVQNRAQRGFSKEFFGNISN